MSLYRPDFDSKCHPPIGSANGRYSVFVDNSHAVPWGFWDVAKATLLIVGLTFISVFALFIVFLLAPWGISGAAEEFLISLLFYGAALAGVWFFSLRKYGASWRTLGFRRTTLTHMLLLAPMAVALSWGFDISYTYALELFEAEAFIPKQEAIEEAFEESTFKPLLYIDINVLAPVSEEILFRGFILAGLAFTLGRVSGALISSVLFSAVHIDIDVMPPIFVFSMLLAWLYIRTGSIWPPIAAHALNNMIATMQYELLG